MYFFLGTIALIAMAGDARGVEAWRNFWSAEDFPAFVENVFCVVYCGGVRCFTARAHVFPEFMRRTGMLVFSDGAAAAADDLLVGADEDAEGGGAEFACIAEFGGGFDGFVGESVGSGDGASRCILVACWSRTRRRSFARRSIWSFLRRCRRGRGVFLLAMESGGRAAVPGANRGHSRGGDEAAEPAGSRIEAAEFAGRGGGDSLPRDGIEIRAVHRAV